MSSVSEKRAGYSRFDDMSSEELENILRADSELPDGEISDTDMIVYIASILAQREKAEPSGRFESDDAAWERFETQNACAARRKTVRRLRARRMIAAAAVIVLIVAGALSVSARESMRSLSSVKWTDDELVVNILPGDGTGVAAGENEDPDAELERVAPQLGTIAEYLIEDGYSTHCLPSYIPEGYRVGEMLRTYDPVTHQFLSRASVTMVGRDGDHCVVTYRILRSNDRTNYDPDDPDTYTKTVYSKNAGKPEILEFGGRKYYIFSNMDNQVAVWVQGNAVGCISINDRSELIKIIKSTI